MVIPAYYSETARRGNMYRALDDGSLPVKEIGSADDEKENGAFARTNITEIEIPGTVELIGNGAFYETNLTSIEIPEGIKELGIGAFMGSYFLSSITIPASVTYIWGHVLSGSPNLTNIIVAEDNPVYSAEGGILYDISGNYKTYNGDNNDYGNKVLVSWPSASGSVTIPAGVTSIGVGAFSMNYYMTDLTIPAGVTKINYEAIWGCYGLTSITISETVTDFYAPLSIGASNLKSITVAAGNPNFSSESGILYNKAKTEMIFVPSGISGSITIPNGIQTIGNSAFNGCTSLTSLTIPVSVTYIGISAFSQWTSSQTINIDGFANQQSADAAWGKDWRYGCNAVIKYWNGSSYQ